MVLSPHEALFTPAGERDWAPGWDPALDDGLADLGLSAGEINALACIDEQATVRDLVTAAAQRPSTLTGVLDRLERRGLIERATNPADRRSVLVPLTSQGCAHAARVAAAYEALEPVLRRVLKDIT